MGLDSRQQLKNEEESNRKMMQEIQKNVLRKSPRVCCVLKIICVPLRQLEKCLRYHGGGTGLPRLFWIPRFSPLKASILTLKYYRPMEKSALQIALKRNVPHVACNVWLRE